MRTFKINANKTLLYSNAFTLPTCITKEWSNNRNGLFELDGKKYPISITGKHMYLNEKREFRYKAFQASLNKDLSYEIITLFCHTFMILEDIENTLKSEECIEVEFDEETNYFKVINKNVITNEYTKYIKKLAERNELALSTKYDNDMKHLINYSSEWIPISEIKNHTGVKKCIYMWADMNKKYLYIGKADDLVIRLKQHKNIQKNHEECTKKYGDTFKITHFRYDIVSSYIAKELLESLEMRSIRAVASIIPNRSKEKCFLKSIIKNSEWKLINNKYNYH